MFLRSIGLPPSAVKILVNDRKLAETQLDKIGIGDERRNQVFRLVDRRDRMPLEKWSEWVLEEGLNQEELQKLQDSLGDQEAWKDSDSLKRFFEAVESLGISEYVAYDPTVIRGLDYYTGTVFEAQIGRAHV